MISFFPPAMVIADAPPKSAGWLALLWRRHNPASPDAPLPTHKILDVIDRVRGAEANLLKIKAEVKCGH